MGLDELIAKAEAGQLTQEDVDSYCLVFDLNAAFRIQLEAEAALEDERHADEQLKQLLDTLTA